MVITDRINNPVYLKVNEWLVDRGVKNINVFELNEKDVFYYAMQMEFPGVSASTTDIFFRIANQLMR